MNEYLATDSNGCIGTNSPGIVIALSLYFFLKFRVSTSSYLSLGRPLYLIPSEN